MSLVYLRGVTTLRLDQERCTGCEMCLEVCPHAVLHLDGDHVVVGDPDACIECGACMTNCEAEAVTVRVGVGCARAVLTSGPGAPACCA
jgi:NAD-dependent dihydropyrimidine dehydrogenase PreA subunit